MGTIKVNNDDVWNDYVKTGKVKGFSIEGFFADKIEAQKMSKEEKEAELLLSKITNIVKGERVELGLIDDLMVNYKALIKVKDIMDGHLSKAKQAAIKGDNGIKNFNKKFKDIETASKQLGIPVKDVNIQKLNSEIKEFTKDFNKVIKS